VPGYIVDNHNGTNLGQRCEDFTFRGVHNEERRRVVGRDGERRGDSLGLEYSHIAAVMETFTDVVSNVGLGRDDKDR